MQCNVGCLEYSDMAMVETDQLNTTKRAPMLSYFELQTKAVQSYCSVH